MKRRGFLGLLGSVIGATWFELPLWAQQKMLFKTGDRHPDPNMNCIVFVQYCENGHPIWTSDYNDPDAPYRLRAQNADIIPCDCTPYIEHPYDKYIKGPDYDPSIRWQKPWWKVSASPEPDPDNAFLDQWTFKNVWLRKKDGLVSPWFGEIGPVERREALIRSGMT